MTGWHASDDLVARYGDGTLPNRTPGPWRNIWRAAGGAQPRVTGGAGDVRRGGARGGAGGGTGGSSRWALTQGRVVSAFPLVARW
ncbi:hypothetical protein SALBM311S_04603 [Streptomyces alboniger]